MNKINQYDIIYNKNNVLWYSLKKGNIMPEVATHPKLNQFFSSKEEKQQILTAYNKTYFDDSNKVRLPVGEDDSDSLNARKHAAQKCLGQGILSYVTDNEDLCLLALGRMHQKPISYINHANGKAMLHSSYNVRDTDNVYVSPKPFADFVSRIAGFLIYNKKNHGMCWMDISREGSVVSHDPKAQIHRSSDTRYSTASAELSHTIIKNAEDILIETQQNTDQSAVITGKTRVYINEIAEAMNKKPSFRLQSDLEHLAILPLLPTEGRYTIHIKGSTGPVCIYNPTLVEDYSLMDAIESMKNTPPEAHDPNDAPLALVPGTLFYSHPERSEKFPPYCICPITGAPMTDPVVTNNGRIYERSAITELLTRNPIHPETGNPQTIEDLFAADELREQISGCTDNDRNPLTPFHGLS
tara:strand:- start:7080 stop:8315 length:1236 start_codon:yes stop_codon:yes gene_type:complete